MGTPIDRAIRKAMRTSGKWAIFRWYSTWLSYPENVECNICAWKGRHFLPDSVHEYIRCPVCETTIRQRLLVAALHNLDQLSFSKLITGKVVLHFAPEGILMARIFEAARTYLTADFMRNDCDYRLDMCNMPRVRDNGFNLLIALDVLEHVPDYQKALQEIYRILSPGGFAIIAVPQKDKLAVTDEDPNVVTRKERTERFGQWDHLRVFGDDFPVVVAIKGFVVTTVNELSFPEEIRTRFVLFPPVLSKDPVATNLGRSFSAKGQQENRIDRLIIRE